MLLKGRKSAMLCEWCGEYEANVHITHVVNNARREVNICDACAGKSGIHIQGPMSLSEILMGIGGPEEDGAAGDKRCAFCGLSLDEFRKSSRLGCAVCYDTFAAELNRVLPEFQKGSIHTGRTPAAFDDADGDREIQDMRNALQTAVSAENFEEAARLRDEIGRRKAAAETVKKQK